MSSFLFLAALAGISETAFAGPITYTLSGIASGTINNGVLTPFSGQTFTLTGSSDTTQIVGGVNPSTPFLSNATFSVTGIGFGTISDQMTLVDFQSGQLITLVDFTTGSTAGEFAAPFASYALATGIGPVSGTPNSYPAGFDTSLGFLTLSNASSSTFNATTPEPRSLVLVALGLASAAFIRKRKHIGNTVA